MKINGQNLVEFGIIFGLVVIASITALTLFGNNINAMFSGSNKKISSYKPFDWDNGTKGNSNSLNSLSPGETGIVDNYNYNVLSDGKVSLEVEGQSVVVDQNIIEAAGSSGLGDEIAYLIQKYKDKYPDEDVPVETFEAISNRVAKDYSVGGSVTEITEANPTTVIKVGDHLIMLQNENNCIKKGSACNEKDASKLEGDFRIEGDIVTKNGEQFFEGQVIRTDRIEEKIAKTEAKLEELINEGDQKKIEKEKEKLEKLKKEQAEGKPVTITSKIDTENGLKLYDTKIDGDMDEVKRKDLKLWEIEF